MVCALSDTDPIRKLLAMKMEAEMLAVCHTHIAIADRFEGIGKFPGTYHIYLRADAIPVLHTPQKCPKAI